MFHLTFMGGSEVQLHEPDNIVVTVWGGTDIKMPTLASKITFLLQMKQENRTSEEAVRRTNVITLMGGAAFSIPTVAQEIEEMCQLRDSGLVTDNELSLLWQEAIRHGPFDILETFTVMGGAGDEVPSRKAELKALDRLALRGLISAEELEDLRKLITADSFKTGRTTQIQEKLRVLMLPPGREEPILLPSFRQPDRKLNTFE